ncbi:hypothetical protein [Dyadobacter frigoris]|uniref:DUF4097 domain-containing protein n=1 Tax=Dyadobacter frigoris TaxID=2576211 RepID=A0A4U6D804_9BACT|nr:hypothetical protein [Dyadobacter frigoris]TKT92441.1 hypothetical protein FDK13_10755 [Dyadobacter frigoris]GLU53634.1 hypothetical protein Dfri01_30950 [Dyadobacter frigoris]
MKKYTFLLLVLIFNQAFSQKIIDKKLPFTPGQTVNLNLRFGDSIKVRYWDKSEVSVHISATINGGKLNDALTVTTANTAQQISLKTDLDQDMLSQGKATDCPDKKFSYNSEKDGKRFYVCSEINYQVFLPRQAKLILETINGNIDIEGASTAVHAKTISGFVDMSWPKSKGANLGMKTITGEVYTDFTIDYKDKKQKNPIVGYLLEGTMNGGGPEIKLESISNNVYFRQLK